MRDRSPWPAAVVAHLGDVGAQAPVGARAHQAHEHAAAHAGPAAAPLPAVRALPVRRLLHPPSRTPSQAVWQQRRTSGAASCFPYLDGDTALRPSDALLLPLNVMRSRPVSGCIMP